MNYREDYVKAHGLDFDFKYSDCHDCELVECGYYYGKCPNE